MLIASAQLVHHDPAIYPDPYAFRPERFLDAKPGTYTWLPFGGGRRRCLGASFALLEMRVVLRAAAERFTVAPAGPRAPAEAARDHADAGRRRDRGARPPGRPAGGRPLRRGRRGLTRHGGSTPDAHPPAQDGCGPPRLVRTNRPNGDGVGERAGEEAVAPGVQIVVEGVVDAGPPDVSAHAETRSRGGGARAPPPPPCSGSVDRPWTSATRSSTTPPAWPATTRTGWPTVASAPRLASTSSGPRSRGRWATPARPRGRSSRTSRATSTPGSCRPVARASSASSSAGRCRWRSPRTG